MKVTIVGSGFVGSTAAQLLAQKDITDIVLFDIVEGMPQGKALDMMQMGAIIKTDSKIKGTNDYKDTKDSELVIITAGIPRKPGMSRDDLLEINEKIMTDVVKNVSKQSPKAILIIVSNPLDAMVYVAKKISKFPKERVMGMAGILDTARFKAFLAMESNTSVKDINAMVLGGHGDNMVPLSSSATINKKPLTEFIKEEKIKKIEDRTRKGGAEIVGLLKTGSAYFAPAASIVEMAESILKDKKTTLPVSVYLEGEYGYNNIFLGVPVVLGKDGVEKIIELDLNKEEKDGLKKTAAHVKELIGTLEK